MLRRYEFTDQEWDKIKDLLPPENSGKRGRPSKDNRTMFNGIIWIVRSGAPWRDLPEHYDPWESVYFVNGLMMAILTISFGYLALKQN